MIGRSVRVRVRVRVRVGVGARVRVRVRGIMITVDRLKSRPAGAPRASRSWWGDNTGRDQLVVHRELLAAVLGEMLPG